MNDIRKKSFSFACLIVVAMVKRFSLQIYLKQSCLEVIFLDYIFSQSININMLLQVVKKVSYANRSSHQNIFMVSDNIRITWTTHSTLKILISLVYNFSYVCLKQRWNISQTYWFIIFNENHVAFSIVLGIFRVIMNFRHHYHLLI